jgi:hypothetical protein
MLWYLKYTFLKFYTKPRKKWQKKAKIHSKNMPKKQTCTKIYKHNKKNKIFFQNPDVNRYFWVLNAFEKYIPQKHKMIFLINKLKKILQTSIIYTHEERLKTKNKNKNLIT